MRNFAFLLAFIPSVAFGQFYIDQLNVNQSESIGKGGPADPSAVLDMVSVTQGALFPRMTATQMNAIVSPATGLVVFNTTAATLYNYNGASWVQAGTTSSSPVVTIGVTSANGFAGTSSGGGNPSLTLSTSITGVLKGNGTAISTATSGTDYAPGTSANATGIVKSTTTTGALTTAVAGDFPTLNQNTSGTAAGLSSTLAIASGGTGQISSSTAFNALSPLGTKGDLLYENATPAAAVLGIGSSGNVLTVSGGLPTWAAPATSGTVTSITFNSPLTGGAITGSGSVGLGTVSPSIGGLGLNASSSSGVPVFTSGSVAIGTLSPIYGGLGVNGSAANGVPVFASGAVAIGTLSPNNGGTGVATIPTHAVMLGEGTVGIGTASPSTLGYALASNGASSDPTFQLLPVAGGGTALASGTSGGILGYTATGTLASSTLLAAHGVVLGGGSGATPATLATNASTAFPLVSGGASANPSWAGLTIAGGGTSVTSVTTAPAATSWAGWDANLNMNGNSFVPKATTTVTSASTTTLTVASAMYQEATGSTASFIYKLPVASTMATGQQFVITNNSSVTITVQTSGATTVQAMVAGTILNISCSNTAGGTGTASWTWVYSSTNASLPGGTGTVTSVSASVPNGLSVSGVPFTTTGTIAIANNAVTSKSISYALAATDRMVMFTTSTSALVATIPTAAGISGTEYTITKVDTGTGTVAIATTSAQTIGGRASSDIVLGVVNDTITVVSDGSNWQIVAKKETQYVSQTANTGINIVTCGTASYCALTNNCMTLGIGQWRVSGYFQLYVSGASASYLDGESGFFQATGANSGTPPTALTGVSGVSGLTEMTTTAVTVFPALGSEQESHTIQFTLTNTVSQSVCIVPFVQIGASGTGYVGGVEWAERIW